MKNLFFRIIVLLWTWHSWNPKNFSPKNYDSEIMHLKFAKIMHSKMFFYQWDSIQVLVKNFLSSRLTKNICLFWFESISYFKIISCESRFASSSCLIHFLSQNARVHFAFSWMTNNYLLHLAIRMSRFRCDSAKDLAHFDALKSHFVINYSFNW